MCSDFETIAETPTEWASSSENTSQYSLKTISGTAGINLLRTLAASMPFITGIERSSTIKSGCSSCAFSIASRPFSASPHTSKSASDVNNSQSARRIISTSSTTKTDLATGQTSVRPNLDNVAQC